MSRLGRLLGLILALAGFAAARTLVPAGNAMEVPVPTVTVSVPSLPAPLPPAPTVTVAPTVSAPTVTTPTVPAPTPTVTTPAPPPVRLPPPPAPGVTVPVATTAPAQPPVTTAGTTTASTPRSSPAPTRGSAPATGGGSAGTPSSPGGSTSAGAGRGAVTGRGTVSTSDRRRSTTRSHALAAKPHTTRTRVSVRLRFALPGAGRLFLIVRGPVPSCRVAGVIPLRGRKGVNTLYFAGRVHGRRLGPGVYQLSLSGTRRPHPGAPETPVRVVSARRAVPVTKPVRLPACTVAQAYFDDGTRRILLIETKQQQRPTATLAAVPKAPLRPPLSGDVADGDDEGLAGYLPGPGSVGGGSPDSGLEAFAAIAVLVIVATLLLGMVALVARFLRGSWNP